jgi:hypothetical protein
MGRANEDEPSVRGFDWGTRWIIILIGIVSPHFWGLFHGALARTSSPGSFVPLRLTLSA